MSAIISDQCTLTLAMQELEELLNKHSKEDVLSIIKSYKSTNAMSEETEHLLSLILKPKKI